ncbi:MAG: hypothetical protein ACK4VI_07075 [Alphaproteobacteria bacterium]
MMKKLLNVTAIVVLALSAVGFSGVLSQAQASSCYESREAEAEQGIRIHSELMVIGLNCQHMATANGQNLYAAYREFTARHGNLFGTYETIMMAHFRKSGKANPEAHMNLVRTEFANKISNDAATMRPDIFCKAYSPRMVQAIKMSQDDLRKWAATIYPSHPVSKPLCASAMAQN